MSSYYKHIISVFSLLFITSCSTTPKFNHQPLVSHYTLENRIPFLTTINNWQIKGKIAFIDKQDRKSASLFWQNSPNSHTEQLTLTTFLGINVLDVSLANNIYTINVDQNTYQHTNIDTVLSSLTGYQLPTNALKSWIKAIPFHSNDTVINNKSTQLPDSISSLYGNKVWRVIYHEYTIVKGVPLPKRITLKQNNLIIKIIINQWQF